MHTHECSQVVPIQDAPGEGPPLVSKCPLGTGSDLILRGPQLIPE